MAKGTITPSAIAVNNIQTLPDVVVGQAGSLKTLFDKGDSDQQTYINTVLIPELNGNDGSKKIGHNSVNIAADNVNEAIEEVYAAITSTVIGEIPNNSITDAKLAVDNKVGSLATLGTTEKSSVVGAINEIEGEVDTLITDVGNLTTSVGANTTNLEVLRKFNPTTGSNVALAVDTFGTFDFTKNGNILNIIPNVTNTGAMTINPDGQGAKSIKKFDLGTDAYVDVAAGDVPKNTPISLAWILASNFFVLAPKGKDLLKGLKNTTVTNLKANTNTTTLRTTVSGNGWVLCIPRVVGSSESYALKVDGVYKIGSATTGVTISNTQSTPLFFKFNSSFEFYATGTNMGVVYCLGTDLSKPVLLTGYNLNSGGATANTIINVSGKGWFKGISNFNNTAFTSTSVKITIDGVVQFSGNSVQLGNLDLLLRFETSLLIQTDVTTQMDFVYTLD